jgi:hypothetical protein
MTERASYSQALGHGSISRALLFELITKEVQYNFQSWENVASCLTGRARETASTQATEKLTPKTLVFASKILLYIFIERAF